MPPAGRFALDLGGHAITGTLAGVKRSAGGDPHEAFARMRDGGVGVTGILVGFGAAQPAQASDLAVPIDYTVNASTTLAKLHQTVVVPPGTFVGSIDLTTGALTGNLSLPPATTTVSEGGLGLATATFALQPVKAVTGTVNLTTLVATATATFNVAVQSVKPLGLVNIVGDRCQTSQPISVTFTGPISLSGSSSFSGDYAFRRSPIAGCSRPCSTS